MKTPEFANDIKVGGKTPEEIKKGLEGCGGLDGDCENCPYDEQTIYCNDRLMRDALAYIQQLEGYLDEEGEHSELLEIEVNQLKKRLAQVERERDAAVADLDSVGSCITCVNNTTPMYIPNDCLDCIRGSNHKWRGVCPENTKEE